MNIRRIVSILALHFLLLASQAIQAGAQQSTLILPEELNLLSVDDNKYAGKFFGGNDTRLELAPGLHRVVVEYEIFFDISVDEHQRILSKPFQITFNAEPGKQYSIKLPSFDDVENAEKYASKPVFELIDRSTNQNVAADVVHHEGTRGLFAQFNQQVEFNKPVRHTIPAAAVPVRRTVTSSHTTDDMPATMLKYWWGQASEQQRRNFIKYLK